MFDIGAWGEFILVAVIAFVVIGPKDMPKALYQLGRVFRSIKKFLDQSGGQFDALMMDMDHKKMNEEILKMEAEALRPVPPQKQAPKKTASQKTTSKKTAPKKPKSS